MPFDYVAVCEDQYCRECDRKLTDREKANGLCEECAEKKLSLFRNFYLTVRHRTW